MLDRFGNTIWAGFTEHEILRIEAALTMDRVELTEALHDIASMSGRSFISVRRKAYDMQRDARIALEGEYSRRVMVPGRSQPCPQRAALSTQAPSELNTSARMLAMRMGARA